MVEDTQQPDPDEVRPTEEEYRQLALEGVQHQINESWELTLDPIRDLRDALREGEDPDPRDLLTVRNSFLIADREIVDVLDDVVVGEERPTVRELRELGHDLDEILLTIAIARHEGREVEHSTFETARARLETVSQRLDVLEDQSDDGTLAATDDHDLGDGERADQDENQRRS